MACDAPTDLELQAFIDGELDGPNRARVAAFLLQHPEWAAKMSENRKLNDALKELDRHLLDEPVPQRFLDILERAREDSGD